MSQPHPTQGAPPRLRVVVMSCEPYAAATVAALSQVQEAEVVALVQADWPRSALSIRLRRAIRARGLLGVVGSLPRLALRLLGRWRRPPNPVPPLPAGIPHVRIRAFNSPACTSLLDRWQPDLIVVDGANILRPEVFARPRLGSINLHCGRLPEYRGMPPAFWELLNGEVTVGVTVHRVSERLDEGPILAEASVPLDPAPAGDPVFYVNKLWREQLRSVGVALLADTVHRLATATAQPRPQRPPSGPPFRAPSHADVRELRNRVAARRLASDKAERARRLF